MQSAVNLFKSTSHVSRYSLVAYGVVESMPHSGIEGNGCWGGNFNSAAASLRVYFCISQHKAMRNFWICKVTIKCGVLNSRHSACRWYM